MLNFILATGNAHKAEEFQKILDPKIIQVSAAARKLDVVENGTTYHANALLKAEAYYKEFKTPVMSDDSGLNVYALPNELGIQSARFGGDGLKDIDRVNLLLTKMNDIKNTERGAHFTCVLCFYFSPNEIYFFEGEVHGLIAQQIAGCGGFGYDPIFIPNDLDGVRTIAEDTNWKDLHSHRAKAIEKSLKFFKERVAKV